MKNYFVYIMASKKYGVLYVGITSNLFKRVCQHKEEIFEGFSKKYFVKRLVYFESTNSSIAAIQREKQIKKWNRKWKMRLIEKHNPSWADLYETIST